MLILINKNFLKKCFIFILVFVFYSCDRLAKTDSNQYVPPRYVVLAEEIQYEVAIKLAKKFQMVPIGEGGALCNCVNRLFLAFNIRGPLSKDQLQNILVDSVEEFIVAVNSNEEIRPYLKVYPFTANEIELDLYVIDKRGKEIYGPDISTVSARKGKLIYTITDRNDSFKTKSNITESYEDALNNIRKANDSGLFQLSIQTTSTTDD
jgi:hypothetical protein